MATPEELKEAARQAGEDLGRIEEMKRLAQRPPAFSETPLGRRALQRLSGGGPEDPMEIERALSIAGMATMGAMAGARVPLAPGPAGAVINPLTGALVGGGVGAVAGTLAPEASLQAMEALGLVPEGTREKRGLAPEELRAVAEAEALIDLTLGGAFQVGGMLARGGTRALAGIGRAETEAAETAAAQGIALPAFMAGGGRAGRFFVTVFGRFPFVATPLRRAAEKTVAETERALTGLPDRIAPVLADTEIGRQIATEANTLVKRVGAEFNQRYIDLFDAAELANITVSPKNVLAKGDELIARINSETPPNLEGTSNPGKVLTKVRDFVREEIFSLRAATPEGTATAKLGLRQLDGLISKIDQEISEFEPGQRRFAISLLSQLKTAAKMDGVTNLRGERASDFAGRLRDLDAEFSGTMATLFETATAKRFATVQRRGLRGVTADEATRTPVDRLARVVVDLDSPQAIEELSRLVGPATMRRVASRSLATVFEDAFHVRPDGDRVFRSQEAARKLGFRIDSGPRGIGVKFVPANRGRTQAFERLLAETDIKMKDVQAVLNAAERIASAPIPDVNTFIARRGTLGGLRSIIRGSAPGLALASNLVEAVVGFTLMIGGGRGMSRLLSDPRAARPLKTVLDQTVSRSARRASYLRIIRGALTTAVAGNEITAEDAKTVFRDALDFSRTFTR